MLAEHKEQWAQVFSEHMQAILDKLEAGQANALSHFVHNEIRRCLENKAALQV